MLDKTKKYLWLHREPVIEFIIGQGWQAWKTKEVDVIAETASYVKIRYKKWRNYIEWWIRKGSYSDILQEIK